MNIHHHPSEALLFDYSAGALGEAWSVAIATHLALCPTCRRIVSEMETVGGSLLDSLTPQAVGDDALNAVLARLEQSPNAVETPTPRPAQQTGNGTPVLPQPLRGYIGGDLEAVPWRRLGLGAYQSVIPTQETGASVRLLRIPAGRPVPEHTHGGLELTLVLAGAFSDTTGRYGRGDLQEADETLEHQPYAADGEDCICLAVTDAPLRFKSIAARMVQPLLGI